MAPELLLGNFALDLQEIRGFKPQPQKDGALTQKPVADEGLGAPAQAGAGLLLRQQQDVHN